MTTGVSLSGSAALSASATAGPDPSALWDVYERLTAVAERAGLRWQQQRQAGGSGATAGLLFSAAWEAGRQSSLAYDAYLAAVRAVRPGAAG